MAISIDNLSQRKLEGYLKWSKIIQWGRRNPVKFAESFLGIELMDYQRYAFMNSWDKQFVLWLMTRNGGKALALDTKIPTPNGIKTMKDINIGDCVFDNLGNPTKVLNTSEIFTNHDCYKVVFEDDEEIIADANHLWEVKYLYGRKECYTYTTQQLYDKGICNLRKDGKGKEYKFRVPMNKSLNFERKEFKIHPYILGTWLGDGNSRDTRITSHVDDYEELNRNIISCGYSTSINDRSDNCYNINIGYVGKGKVNLFKKELVNYDLIENKHIPEEYFYGSVEQRLDLLKGLMDTDGTCRKDKNRSNPCEFYQKDYNLIKQVSRLLSGLGIKNKIKQKKTMREGKEFDSYKIYFYTDIEMPCFKMKRKYDLLPEKLNKRMNFKSIVSIEKVASVPTKCIMVDNERKLYLCGEKNTVTHNSTLSAPFAMTKMMLFPNFEAFILSVTSAQSQDTFMKMEKIAKRQIESFTGLTDIFYNEIVKSASNTDGFTHSPQGFKYELFNGSKITSLSGQENNIRGKRSSLNLYDESGWISENYAVTTEGFCLQNADFKLGKDLDMETLTKNIPNQLLYCSSASNVDSYFYDIYKQYSKMMFAGSKNHFVADIDCNVVINATNHGKQLYTPLLTQDKVDSALLVNREKAMREYFNQFSTDGGSNQPIKRATIIRNSTVRKPILCNEDNKNHRFIIAYDPAHDYDNSAVTVGELIYDKQIGYKLRIQNCVSLVDVGKKKKTPMRTPEQTKYIKQMMLDYNGSGFADYENIDKFLVDSGSGGGGKLITDYFMEDWMDDSGVTHRGLVDKIEHEELLSKFPNAVNKLKLISPKKYRTEMFDALIEMLNLGLIDFTDSYDNKGYLTVANDIDDKEIGYEKINLTADEELSLVNIDLMKEEMVMTYKFDGTNGAYRYDLPQDKKSTCHDDRAYTMAMLAWYLQQIRRENITNKKKETTLNVSQLFQFSAPRIRK